VENSAAQKTKAQYLIMQFIMISNIYVHAVCLIRYLDTNFLQCTTPTVSGFGGLVVSMLASGTQDHGFETGQSRRIFWAK
jgi:hypothetical protein